MKYVIVGGLILVFLVAVSIARFKEMRDDPVVAALFLVKVSIPLALIISILLLNAPSNQ